MTHSHNVVYPQFAARFPRSIGGTSSGINVCHRKENEYFMKIISTRVHGVLDYVVGAFLIAVPWLLDFARGGAETWIPVVLGAAAIIYSLITDYEYSVAKKLPMKSHLTLDLLSGIVLAASPWIFDFNEYVYLPHLILGLFEIGASLMTETVPSTERAGQRNIGGQHRHAH